MHPGAIRSLVLISGETFGEGLQFLRQAAQLPGLFVVADDDEYPPTVEAMELLYVTSSSPDAHATPASSWSDTEPYRGEIRRSAQKVLEKLNGA